MYRVDFNVPMWRYLFGPLYERLWGFAQKTQQPEVTVRTQFVKLLQAAPDVLLFVELDDTRIVAHAMVLLLPQVDGSFMAMCEQAEVDQDHAKGSTFIQDVMDYCAGPLRQMVPISKLGFATFRDPRSFERKYGFQRWRTLLEKELPV